MFVMSRVQTGDPNMLTTEGKVFLDEQLEIRRLAMEGPAIFLGHCACDALKNQKGVIKVFIHSEDEEEVKNRITKDYGIAPRKWSRPADSIIRRERDTSVLIQEMTGKT